jgi:hypothetical protein
VDALERGVSGLKIARGLALDPEELAWAAGVFEGEGTITIGRRGRDDTYRLIVTLGNTDAEMVDFFHERWGGWKQPAYGERPGRQPAWYWTVAGPRAEDFLRELAPHVRTQRVRRKVELGLEFRASQSRLKREQARPEYKERHRDLYAQMRALNRRGVQEVPA